MDNALRYVGIARKAGALEIGETNAGAAVRAGKAKLLVLSADASDNARSRAENFVYGRRVLLTRLPFTKEEFSEASGAAGCSMAAFTDTGLASAFLSALASENTDYIEAAKALAAKDEREKARKREAAAHDRKKKAGKSAAKGLRRKQ